MWSCLQTPQLLITLVEIFKEERSNLSKPMENGPMSLTAGVPSLIDLLGILNLLMDETLTINQSIQHPCQLNHNVLQRGADMILCVGPSSS